MVLLLKLSTISRTVRVDMDNKNKLSRKPAPKLSNFLKIILWYTQIFGFTPFGFDTVKVKAIKSKAWFLYSKLFTIIFSSFSIFYLSFYSELLVLDKKFNILIIVKASDLYVNCLKMLLSYSIQIYNRTQLVITINLGIVIRNYLRHLCPGTAIFAKSFQKHCRLLLLTSLIESFIFIMHCFELSPGLVKKKSYIAFIDFVLSNYYHLGILIIIVKIYYSTGMMIGIRLFEMVNDRISEILSRNIMELMIRKSKNGFIGTAVDQDIEQLIYLSVKISSYINSVNKLFSTQILFVIIGCFLSILSSVSM